MITQLGSKQAGMSGYRVTKVQLAKQELQAQRLDANHANISKKYRSGQRRKDSTECSMLSEFNQTIYAGIDGVHWQ
jgi:hypothetical protein